MSAASKTACLPIGDWRGDSGISDGGDGGEACAGDKLSGAGRVMSHISRTGAGNGGGGDGSGGGGEWDSRVGGIRSPRGAGGDSNKMHEIHMPGGFLRRSMLCVPCSVYARQPPLLGLNSKYLQVARAKQLVAQPSIPF